MTKTQARGIWRFRIALVLTVVVPTRAFGQGPSGGGPFGLVMGMSMEEAERMSGGKLEGSASHPGLYMLKSVPRPHASFIGYAMISTRKTGLCKVQALTAEFQADAYGVTARKNFEDLAAQISAVYGASKRTDILRAGSIWRDPNEWMTALAKGERTLADQWTAESKATLKDGITGIILQLQSSDRDTARITVAYHFQNTPACEEALKLEQAGAF